MTHPSLSQAKEKRKLESIRKISFLKIDPAIPDPSPHMQTGKWSQEEVIECRKYSEKSLTLIKTRVQLVLWIYDDV